MKKTVDNFQPAGGMHCITNAMKQIFNFYGHPLSEEMLFGLGEGLDFAYINMAHSPMVSGRSKIMEFEGILSKRLGVGMKFRKVSCLISVILKMRIMQEFVMLSWQCVIKC